MHFRRSLQRLLIDWLNHLEKSLVLQSFLVSKIVTVKQLGLGILVAWRNLWILTLVDSDTRFLANLSSQLLYYAMYNHNTKKEEVILPNPRCWFYGRDYYYEGLLEIQVPFWTFHARLPPLGHFLPSATLIDWTRPCHPEVSDARDSLE